jgi:hypothetical protein
MKSVDQRCSSSCNWPSPSSRLFVCHTAIPPRHKCTASHTLATICVSPSPQSNVTHIKMCARRAHGGESRSPHTKDRAAVARRAQRCGPHPTPAQHATRARPDVRAQRVFVCVSQLAQSTPSQRAHHGGKREARGNSAHGARSIDGQGHFGRADGGCHTARTSRHDRGGTQHRHPPRATRESEGPWRRNC